MNVTQRQVIEQFWAECLLETSHRVFWDAVGQNMITWPAPPLPLPRDVSSMMSGEMYYEGNP